MVRMKTEAIFNERINSFFISTSLSSIDILNNLMSKLPKEKLHILSSEKECFNAAIELSHFRRNSLIALNYSELQDLLNPLVKASNESIESAIVMIIIEDKNNSTKYEEDSRLLGKYLSIPVFEPSNLQELNPLIFDAIEISNRFQIPAIIRLSSLFMNELKKNNDPLYVNSQKTKFPDEELFSRFLHEKYSMLTSYSIHSIYNQLIDKEDKSIGIVACGIAFQNLISCYTNNTIRFPVLKISQYPISRDLIALVYDECDEILVLEEGHPFVEEQIRGLMGRGTRIRGKMDGILSRFGEMSTENIALALGL